MGIKVSEFGKTSKGKIAHIYTLVNGKGMALEVTDYGATMVSILAPDAKGRSKDVLLGYDEEGIMNRFARAYGYQKPARGDANEAAQDQG